MSTIEVRQLTKEFGKLKAVDAVDLAVAAGETVCLLGPSGCGKTTTLRMVAGLENATAGDVMLAGKRVNNLAAAQRNVAMTFQFYALYPSLTVAENLIYPLHAERVGAGEMQRRLKDVARILQLEHALGRKPAELAEGEKQRVAVGRCIIRDANCFLFDEPLSRLDVALREEMRGEIKAVLARLEKATVIVTHDQLEALTMADRIAVMRAGRIEQIASPHDIFAKPANLFVAAFIGTPEMNLLPAELVRVEGSAGDGPLGTFRVGSGDELTISVAPALAERAPGTKVTLGARPRHVAITPQSTQDALPARVDLIEPMGAETLLHLTSLAAAPAPGGEAGADQDIRVVCDWRTEVSEGERVHLRFPPGAVHVFDESGRAVRA